MPKCDRDLEMDLHVQDILLIGDKLQQSVAIIRAHGAEYYERYHARCEAVATSRQTAQGLMAALRGDSDTEAIKEFLAALREKYVFPLDEIVPEVDALLEAACLRASQGPS